MKLNALYWSRVLDVLLKVDTSGNHRSGICRQVEEQCYWFVFQYKPDLSVLFEGWEHHSGDDSYPVPCPRGMRDPRTIFRRKYAINALWEGEYGKLRKDLLKHCINKCRALIEQEGKK